MESLRHITISGEWLDTLIAACSGISRLRMKRGEFDSPALFGQPLWSVMGNVGEHRDLSYNRWSYMLILEAGTGKSVLFCEGRQPLTLQSGMVVEFDAHALHRLAQPKRDALIWAAIDLIERVTPEEAAQIHSTTWQKAMSLSALAA